MQSGSNINLSLNSALTSRVGRVSVHKTIQFTRESLVALLITAKARWQWWDLATNVSESVWQFQWLSRHIMNLLWSLSDKGTRVRFCWVPSQCGIDGNETVYQLSRETFDQDIDPLASVHYTDMKPLVNSYIQRLVQTKWDVAVHGRDLYLVNKYWDQRRSSST